MNSNLLKTTLVAAAGLLFANSTLAATATTTFKVTATVASSCKVTATDLLFGAYDPFAAALGTSTITATCTAQTPYTIGLDAGLNAGGSTTRHMTGDDFAATLLSYELYSDTTRTAIWGAPGGTATVAHSALTGGALDYTVYGRIPASQYVPAANYEDTVTVTVTY